MRRVTGFLLMVMLFGTGCFLNAASAFEINGRKVDITVTDSYVSRYIWRGLDIYVPPPPKNEK